MQITINQSEIEAAIKAHILSQINIKDGHDISITLKATRGDDGTTAIIDITPSAASVSVGAPTTPVKRESSGLGIKDAVTKAKETAQEPVKSEPKAEPKAKEEKAEDPPFQADTNAPELTDGAAVAASSAETASAEESTTPRTSLFAGLQKPTNS